MRQEDLPKANATCKICGARYYRCADCLRLKANGVHTWKQVCDTPQCYQMYISLNDYKDGKTTKAQAKEALESLDGRVDMSAIVSPYMEMIEEIMRIDKPVVLSLDCMEPDDSTVHMQTQAKRRRNRRKDFDAE